MNVTFTQKGCEHLQALIQDETVEVISCKGHYGDKYGMGMATLVSVKYPFVISSGSYKDKEITR
jgi:hypothetical protein